MTTRKSTFSVTQCGTTGPALMTQLEAAERR